MIENDTIKLLRECDSGVKMGISSIGEVLEKVENEKFKNELNECKSKHMDLEKDIENLLNSYHDDGKNPNPFVKGMSWFKSNMMLAVNESDETIADLMTDGCNMGVKSLSKYLNKYQAADEKSKDIAKKLIKIESNLTQNIQTYL